MRKMPELRVTRDGGLVKRVVWIPGREDAVAADITDMLITQIDTVITPDSLPQLRLTITAMLVEEEV